MEAPHDLGLSGQFAHFKDSGDWVNLCVSAGWGSTWRSVAWPAVVSGCMLDPAFGAVKVFISAKHLHKGMSKRVVVAGPGA
jgi:hypothetical protein